MSWETDLKRGEIGEGLVLSYLHSLPGIMFIKDVRKEEKWQEADVDFLVYTETQVTKIEAKMEMAEKCLFYELESYGKIGCFERSKADRFIVYLPEMGGKLLSIKAKELREYAHSKEWKLKETGTSKGYSLPINDLVEKNIAKVVGNSVV